MAKAKNKDDSKAAGKAGKAAGKAGKAAGKAPTGGAMVAGVGCPGPKPDAPSAAPTEATGAVAGPLEHGPHGLDRETVIEAVYLEAIERGQSPRWARAAAEDVADRLRLRDCVRPTERAKTVQIYDLRSEQDYEYPNGANKVRKHGLSPVMRNAELITTVAVHQTAVEFGVSARSVRASNGDVELARARRSLDVACHTMAFRKGYFAVSHPLLAYVNHAGRFNPFSLGLEIDGRYPGLMDDVSTVAREDLDSTWGGAPTELTDKTVAAACAALEWMLERGLSLGMPIRYVVAHRQSSDNRRSDPGEEIWQRVVREFAVDVLGLTAKLDSPWREGRPVPVAWDPNGIGEY